MAAGSTDPVTILATFRVKPGRDADFERWAHDITAAATPWAHGGELAGLEGELPGRLQI